MLPVITFDANGGTVDPGTMTTQADGTLEKFPTAIWTGHTFEGWYTDATEGDLVDLSRVYTENATLYAHWTVGYVISFDPGSGACTVKQMRTDTYGKLSEALPTPTWSEHTFLGWYTAQTGGGRVTEESVFSAGITVYAHWTDKYTIKFDANGGKMDTSSDTTGTDGKLSKLPTTTWLGHTFLGWYTDRTGGAQVTDQYVFEGDATIYAHWQNGYDIKFDPGSGQCSPKEMRTGTDGKLSTLPTATWTGHTFLGWYTAQIGGTIVTTDMVLAPNLTLYAYWTEEYEITFNPNGGTVDPETMKTGTDGRLSELPEAVRAGYTFAGWYTAQTGGDRVTEEYLFSKGTTVYAHWTDGYIVTFDPNGGSVDPATMITGTDGRLSELPTPEWFGHTFAGWYTAQTGGDRVTEEHVFSASATVYAHWTDGYIITFDPGSGSVDPATMITGTDGKLSELPTAVRFGYTFEGWYTDAAGGDRVTDQYVFESDATVYARWSEGYVVTFDASPGTCSPAEVRTGTDGKIAELPTAIRTGYTFKGWYTDPDGGDPVTEATVLSGAVKLYAHWSVSSADDDDPYPVIPDGSGGSSGKAAGKGVSSAVVLIVACVAAVMAVLLAHTYCSKR